MIDDDVRLEDADKSFANKYNDYWYTYHPGVLAAKVRDFGSNLLKWA